MGFNNQDNYNPCIKYNNKTKKDLRGKTLRFFLFIRFLLFL